MTARTPAADNTAEEQPILRTCAADKTARKQRVTRPRAAAVAAEEKPKSETLAVEYTDDPVKLLAIMKAQAQGFAAMAPDDQNAAITALRNMRKRPKSFAVTYEKGVAGASPKIGEAQGVAPSAHWLRLLDTFGTESTEFAMAQLDTIANHFNKANSRGCSSREMNAALALIGGMKPQNEVEAMLLVQMVITNDAATRCLAVFNGDPATGNLAAKLARTSVMQAEALAKMRRGGEQVVKHIHIDNRGGQAVVAETVQTGGVSSNGSIQTHEPEFAGSAALLGHDAGGFGVPVPGDEGQEALSASWRESDGRT